MAAPGSCGSPGRWRRHPYALLMIGVHGRALVASGRRGDLSPRSLLAGIGAEHRAGGTGCGGCGVGFPPGMGGGVPDQGQPCCEGRYGHDGDDDGRPERPVMTGASLPRRSHSGTATRAARSGAPPLLHPTSVIPVRSGAIGPVSWTFVPGDHHSRARIERSTQALADGRNVLASHSPARTGRALPVPGISGRLPRFTGLDGEGSCHAGTWRRR